MSPVFTRGTDEAEAQPRELSMKLTLDFKPTVDVSRYPDQLSGPITREPAVRHQTSERDRSWMTCLCRGGITSMTMIVISQTFSERRMDRDASERDAGRRESALSMIW